MSAREYSGYPHIEDSADYSRYEAAVERGLGSLTFVSSGVCRGCDRCGLAEDASEDDLEIAGEGSFSWLSCDVCDRALGGDRYPLHGRDCDDSIVHLDVCTDCYYYAEYGVLDDSTMLDCGVES